jgi:hypothetical protein
MVINAFYRTNRVSDKLAIVHIKHGIRISITRRQVKRNVVFQKANICLCHPRQIESLGYTTMQRVE